MFKSKSTYIGKTIQFPKDNMYFYSQDMCYNQSIPSGINFEIVEKLPTKRYMLIANGYGESNYGKDGYGNGAIFVNEKTIKEVVEMSEPKPYWIASYTISPEKPTSPPPGEAPPPPPNRISPGKPLMYPNEYIINDEPLSTKQLYEIITSQNIRNDQTLIKNAELVKAIKEIRNLVNGTYYIIEPSLAQKIHSIIRMVL